MEIAQLYQLFKSSIGVITDTRKIEPGQIYFALKGANFNGNIFAEHAIQQGALFSVIDEQQYQKNQQYILVDDVLQTLQQLAKYHLQQIQPDVILAITGSNGKTTTKELVNAVLSSAYKTHYTKGNLNNHIGIPLTLLEMKEGTQMAIIEMGANHKREIESYCTIVQPTHGIITNCGKAHLEGFGSVEDIRKGKGELYDFLKENEGHVFVNGDDGILLSMLKDRSLTKFSSYGSAAANNYNSTIIKDHPFLEIQFEDVLIHSRLYGSYNYSNIMCAVAAGKFFGVSNQQIKNAIENYHPDNARSQLIEKNDYKLILDAYNANPTSMQHALESFAKDNLENKVVILGDMFELGDSSAEEHQFIADLCCRLGFNTIALVGKDFGNTITPSNVLKFENTIEAQAWFSIQTWNNNEVLLKGSRSMGMEKVVA